MALAIFDLCLRLHEQAVINRGLDLWSDMGKIVVWSAQHVPRPRRSTASDQSTGRGFCIVEIVNLMVPWTVAHVVRPVDMLAST